MNRPIVVIDTADREQVERLTKALVEAAHKHGNTAVSHNGIHGDTTELALREFANPKPPEPTGLYAVVEDDNAVEWVRVELVGKHQWHSIEGIGSRWKDYADITAVRVLSEGVTP